jgi:hypothetical protein
VLVRLAFWTAFALPQRVGSFAEAIMLRPMPEIVGVAIRPTRLFSKQIGALANNLIQASFGLRQDAMRISKWR